MSAAHASPVAPRPLLDGVFKLRFKALGTHCQVQFRAPDISAARAYRESALAWIREFESMFSRFRPDSLLSRVNAAAGSSPTPIPPVFEHLLDLGTRVFELSEEINDGTSLPLTQLWNDAARDQRLPTRTELEEKRRLVGWSRIERGPGWVRLPQQGMALDFGGFGKEFAVDRLVHMANQHGITDTLVDLGRDIATQGRPADQPAWVVGIEDATRGDRVLTRVLVSGQAVASSGNYRRFRVINGKQYGHLIDPRSGEPADTSVGAVTCIARHCLTAGIFCQAAFILGETEGLRLLEAQRDVAGLIQSSTRTHRTRLFARHEIPHSH